MEDEKLPRLTAEEFYPKWSMENRGKGATITEFAEAYAQAYSDHAAGVVGKQDQLLRRAAELLRIAEPALNLNMLGPQITPRDTWYDDRHQWMVDAGVEEK